MTFTAMSAPPALRQAALWPPEALSGWSSLAQAGPMGLQTLAALPGKASARES